MRFQTASIVSVTTGRLAGRLVDVMDVVSFLVDRPIHLHELALYVEPGGRAILAVHPRFPDPPPADVTLADFNLAVAINVLAAGETFDLDEALRGVIADDRPPEVTYAAALEAARRAGS